MAGTPRRTRPAGRAATGPVAIAAATVVEWYGPARTTMTDPALAELAISAEGDEASRARALRLLGFAADLPVRAVTVHLPLPLDQIGSMVCPARPVKAALLAECECHPGHHRGPGPLSGRRPRGYRCRRAPRLILAEGLHRAALHHRTPTGGAPRPVRGVGATGRHIPGRRAGQHRRGRDRSSGRQPRRVGDAGRLQHRQLGAPSRRPAPPAPPGNYPALARPSARYAESRTSSTWSVLGAAVEPCSTASDRSSSV